MGLASIWTEILRGGRMFVFFFVELHINSDLITDQFVINGYDTVYYVFMLIMYKCMYVD